MSDEDSVKSNHSDKLIHQSRATAGEKYKWAREFSDDEELNSENSEPIPQQNTSARNQLKAAATSLKRLSSFKSAATDGKRKSTTRQNSLRHFRRKLYQAAEDKSGKHVDAQVGIYSSECCPGFAPKFMTRVLTPRDRFRITWDSVFLILLFYNIFEVPFRIAFENEPDPGSFSDMLNLFVDMFFMCDILINFRTAFYSDTGSLETSPSAIARTYLRKWFWLDLLTSFPTKHVVLLFSGSDADRSVLILPQVFRIFRYARIFKLVRILRLFKTKTVHWDDEKKHTMHRLSTVIKLLFGVLAMTHIGGCALMAVTTFEARDGYYDPQSWITGPKVGIHSKDELDPMKAYIRVFYWVISTMSTVGYGDITPGTDFEILVTSVIVVIGSVSFGYIVGSVSSYVTREDHTTSLVKDRVKNVKEYMKYRNLPDELQLRIRSHYEYMWKLSTVYNERQILNELPSFLRAEVVHFLFSDIIDDLPFFQNIGRDAADTIVPMLNPAHVSAGEHVYYEYDIGRDLYIIIEGELELVQGNNVVKILRKGNSFGLESILTAVPGRRLGNVRARTYSHLLHLDKDKFDSVMTLFPKIMCRLIDESIEFIKELIESNNARIRTTARHNSQIGGGSDGFRSYMMKKRMVELQERRAEFKTSKKPKTEDTPSFLKKLDDRLTRIEQLLITQATISSKDISSPITDIPNTIESPE